MGTLYEYRLGIYRNCLKKCAELQVENPTLEKDYFYASRMLLYELNSRPSVFKGRARSEVLQELEKAALQFHNLRGLNAHFDERHRK